MDGLSSDPPPPELCFSCGTWVPAGESRFSVLSFFSLSPLPSPVLAGVSTSPGARSSAGEELGQWPWPRQRQAGKEGARPPPEPLPVGRVPQGLQGAAGPMELILVSAVV